MRWSRPQSPTPSVPRCPARHGRAGTFATAEHPSYAWPSCWAVRSVRRCAAVRSGPAGAAQAHPSGPALPCAGGCFEGRHRKGAPSPRLTDASRSPFDASGSDGRSRFSEAPPKPPPRPSQVGHRSRSIRRPPPAEPPFTQPSQSATSSRAGVAGCGGGSGPPVAAQRPRLQLQPLSAALSPAPCPVPLPLRFPPHLTCAMSRIPTPHPHTHTTPIPPTLQYLIHHGLWLQHPPPKLPPSPPRGGHPQRRLLP